MGEEVMVAVPESVLKKQKREEEWELAKKQELAATKKKNAENRKLIFNRAKQYAKEYEEQGKQLVQLKREARLKGGFYVDPEAKLLFIIRIRGINAMHPKTRSILQLLRLRQMRRVEEEEGKSKEQKRMTTGSSCSSNGLLPSSASPRKTDDLEVGQPSRDKLLFGKARKLEPPSLPCHQPSRFKGRELKRTLQNKKD